MSGEKESKDLYQQTRDDLLKRQLSNSENFDRAILTLSSAALGLSLTFGHLYKLRNGAIDDHFGVRACFFDLKPQRI